MSGGYRDILMNLRWTNGHVVEVQFHLHKLIAIKSGGGHVPYELAWLLGLFEPETMSHVGILTESVLENISAGIFRQVECRGPECRVTAHFGGLLGAIRSPACTLIQLRLPNVDWPPGKPVSELLDALKLRGRALRSVGLANEGAAAACEIPADFFEACPNIEFFNVSGSNITGAIPGTIEACSRLRMFFVQNNQLSGERFPRPPSPRSIRSRLWISRGTRSSRLATRAENGSSGLESRATGDKTPIRRGQSSSAASPGGSNARDYAK